MLVRYSVSNYKSFKNRASLSMVKSRGRLLSEQTINIKNRLSLLKGAVLYGANASGKTNIIDSFAFAQNFILKGNKEKELIKVQPFLLQDIKDNSGTTFEFEFVLKENIYSYGFTVTPKEVIDEWLCEIHKSNDKYIYTREKQEINIGKDYLSKEDFEELDARKNFVRNNELFLTKTIDLNSNVLKSYINWFESIQILRPNSKPIAITQIMKDSKFSQFLTKLLCDCDTGVKMVTTETVDLNSLKVPENILSNIISELENEDCFIVLSTLEGEKAIAYLKNGEKKADVLRFVHQKEDGSEAFFSLGQESDGTRRLVELSPALYSEDKKLLIIDELDRSLHPALTQFLTDCVLKNNQERQLIISTHETSLLNTRKIRRDEIWFINKNKKGESSLKPLSDFNQRYDKELRKAYLDGRFYGVPRLGEKNGES